MIDPGDIYYLWNRRQWFRKGPTGATPIEWPVHPNTAADAEREAQRIAASLDAVPPKSGLV